MYNQDPLKEKKQSTDFEFIFHDQPELSNVISLPARRDRVGALVSIMGMGYVGAVSSACFCSLGHSVIGIDPDASKTVVLNSGRSPIVESGLEDLLYEARRERSFFATRYTHEAILETDVTLVSVGTPSDASGACDLTYLKQATTQIGRAIACKDSYHVVVYRSTVPPTTTQEIMIPILEASSGKRCGVDFGVAFNPEFLRESTAVDDFYHPPKTVIGAIDRASARVVERLYAGVDGEVIVTSLESAEFVKYVDNTWHALKVSFGNEIGRLCKAVGVDSHDVMDIFLSDTKLNISSYYLKPGFAFGGSCLPKDTRGIAHLGRELGVELPVINNINDSNQQHIEHTLELVRDRDCQNIGLIGVTFKAGTDDLRESPAVKLLQSLLEEGYEVLFYDPCINSNSRLVSDSELNDRLLRCQSPNLESFRAHSELMLVSHDADYARTLVNQCDTGQSVIDLVRVSKMKNSFRSQNYSGICW
jgi:GDP-mannose 6-dehydrogenase